jgi:hypothetical protein
MSTQSIDAGKKGKKCDPDLATAEVDMERAAKKARERARQEGSGVAVLRDGKIDLKRRYPIGAELQPNGGTHFRVWAPRPKKVEVLLEAGPGAPTTVQLERQEDGYFAGQVPQAAEGTRYRFRLDDAHCWITLLEVMPVADFPGRFGWGYDGVGMFAPVHQYGEPDDFRRFVNEAHRVGLGVILDDRRKLLLDAASPEAREGTAAELVLAADQFLITPVGRLENSLLSVPGDGGKTVIAGYHWFTDWGRDTMISLEGLTLKTGRSNEAVKILLTFANYVRDGLIPNMFPEGEREGLYHTSDATLWFFHAIHRMKETADRVRESFNLRFWYEQGGYLYDVVDAENGGSDDACRPNQIFTSFVDHPVLDEARWQQVIDVVTDRLLTPVGLRFLTPVHPDYKARYYGDLRSRDAAYHQGIVWAWLIGPYVDAWLKLNTGKEAEARQFLLGLVAHMNDACIGSVS